MSETRYRFASPVFLSAATLIAGLWLANLGAAADRPRSDTTLDRARRLAEVATQKLESDVRAALLDSQKIAVKDRSRAAERLKKVLTTIENDNEAIPERRESLARMLRGRIHSLEAGTDDGKPLDEKQLQASIRRVKVDKKQDEDQKVQTSLNEILELQKDGKLTEAKRKADELVRQYPSHPAAKIVVQNVSAFDQLASAKSVQADKKKGFNSAMRDVDRSSIAPSGDIEFPKDFKERTKGRKGFGAPKLTAREQSILRALNTPVSVNFKDEKFQDVLQYLSTTMGQPILLDKNSLRDAQIEYDSPVSITVRNVTARTLLRKILGEAGLTYIVKDEALQVVTVTDASKMMQVRSYYLGDLLGVGGGPGDPWTSVFGPGIGQVQAAQNIANILSMVQTTVDPQSWQANGGPGSIFFYYPTMSLVVRQSAEVHAMMSGGFMR